MKLPLQDRVVLVTYGFLKCAQEKIRLPCSPSLVNRKYTLSVSISRRQKGVSI